MRRLKSSIAWALVALGISGTSRAGENPNPTAPEAVYAPAIAATSNSGERAIAGFRVAPGLKVSLFAAEPMVANPVSLAIDEKNRFYVAETYRYHKGVTDIRRHIEWLDEDLASRTIDDRLRMYRKHLGAEIARYGIEHDRIRKVEDRDGDGRADRSTVFADGFNEVLGGIGAGIVAHGDDVWFACIPDLWRLRDRNDDGVADERVSLHRGYGVHVGFLGHDLHGLRFGPDGRIYFSIGDRGFSVKRPEGDTLTEVESGTVLRCNPDGTGLEVFARGLRNPQELAFDEHGNLFTCDNNSDSGDKARWVYVVEGGDSGWRIGFQFLQRPVSRGPWNAERLWDPEQARHAAYLVPPLANISDGPSGLVYDPGTDLLPARYRHHFFLCDFRGTPGQSGIRSFANQPDGASFKLVDSQQVVWGVLATDADFGTDGALYFTDWVEKFSSPAKGRIYRVLGDTALKDAGVEIVREQLAEGMVGRTLDALAELLGNADQRVRQAAQFRLASRGPEGAETLTRVASRVEGNPLARLHAIWGLGQVGRRHPEQLEPVAALLNDGDPEVRAQAAKVVGEGNVRTATSRLIRLLDDPSPRVRFFAAIAMGKVGTPEAVGPLLAMLRENGDRDAYLRHAGVMGLAGAGEASKLLAAADDESASVRKGILLALRRQSRPEIARFLTDRDSDVVLEAARAIHDVPITGALPELAALTVRPGMPAPLVRRVLNANVRLGGRSRAETLEALAARTEMPPAIRVEALDSLGEWAEPPGRDRIVGLWRPIASRPSEEAAGALRPSIARLLTDAPEDVRQAAARAAGRLAIQDARATLSALVSDRRRSSTTRVEALRAIEHLHDPGLADLATKAADDRDGSLRNEALRLLATLRPGEAVRRLNARLGDAKVPAGERQGALRTLGSMTSADADAPLSAWLDRLVEGHVPPEVQLDLLEAARKRHDPVLQRKLARYESTRPQSDPLAAYRETLAGGNSNAGRRIFQEKAEVSCIRCHKVGGLGGEVGPDLSGIGRQRDRLYILEAIVAPGRQVAEGFETRVVATNDGKVIAGVFRADDGKTLTLMTPEGRTVSIPHSTIEEQKRGESAMPDDLVKGLSLFEIRDLVEFLARQKATPRPPSAGSDPADTP